MVIFHSYVSLPEGIYLDDYWEEFANDYPMMGLTIGHIIHLSIWIRR